METTTAFLKERIKVINNNSKGGYFLDCTDEGVALYQRTKDPCVVNNISRVGHTSKRDLAIFIEGFIACLCAPAPKTITYPTQGAYIEITDDAITGYEEGYPIGEYDTPKEAIKAINWKLNPGGKVRWKLQY